MSEEEEHKRLVRSGRELEGRGDIDGAVREYVKARAPAEAGRLLAALGRLEEAAGAILDALAVTPATAGTLANARDREMAKQAAALYARVDQSERSQQILASLAAMPAREEPAPSAPKTSAPPAPSAPAPSAPAPSAPAPSAPTPSPPASSAMPNPPTPSAPPNSPASRSYAPNVTASRPGAPRPVTSAPSFRPPAQAGTPSFRPPASASGSFRPPSRAPAAEESLRSARPPAVVTPTERPERPASAGTTPPERPAVERPNTPAPERPASARTTPPAPATPVPERPAGGAAPTERPGAPSADRNAPSVRAASERAPSSGRPTPRERPVPSIPPDGKAHERLSASGEKVTDYSSSRESGWRDAGDESIDETIEQNLAAGRKGAAARIAWDAGRFEQALAWFREIELHYQAGACLRSLGRHREALEELLLTPSDGAHYRKACLEIVPAARALETLEFDVDRYLARFVDEGPKQPDEIDVFMQLAQLYRARDFAQGARRCCAKILALDPQHAEALAMRAQIDERAARPAHDSSTPPGELPSLPTLEEYVRLARANAPPRPGD